MPGSPLNEDSFFFIPVNSICHRPAITCEPGITITEMSGMMKKHNISGIVVTEDEKPVGIVSLRDLRNLIADSSSEFRHLKVRDVMKTGLITIRTDDYLFKAIFLMAKHNIHRLVVVDENDRLCGIMTDTDLLRVQTRSPIYLVQEIESAATVEHLKQISKKMFGMLEYAVKTNADAQSLIQLIAYFNDAFTHRLIHILDTLYGISLPEGAAFLVLGSEGREEQTLRTDQDNAIVYCDSLSDRDIERCRVFGENIVSSLERVGVPLCPGGIMANRPEWFHSLSEWHELIEHWITNPDPESVVNFGVFQDLRVIHGDLRFETDLRSHIISITKANSIFFPNMARNIVRFKPPLGFFGRFKTEKCGEHKGRVDLKKGGIFAITRGIGLLALETGIVGGSTWSKLDRLLGEGFLSESDQETIKDAFTFLVKMRLEKQLISLKSGKDPVNCVDPLVLKEREKDDLRNAFKGSELLLSVLKHRYQLDMMSR